MSPSASCSLIGRARVELVSDWSKERGGGGEALVAAGAAASRTRQAGRGQLRCSSGGGVGEWETGRRVGEWGGSGGGMSESSHGEPFSTSFWAFFRSFLDPFLKSFCEHFQGSTMLFGSLMLCDSIWRSYLQI